MTILAGWPDTKNERPQCIRAYRPYRDKLTVHNGVIFRGNCHHFKSILRPGMLTILVSHLWAEACLRKARDVIYWSSMNPKVKHFTSNCTVCNDYKEALISCPIPSSSWIAMDIMTVFGSNYLIAVDFYFDFWKLDTQPNKPTATSVIWCHKINFSWHCLAIYLQRVWTICKSSFHSQDI